MNIFHHTDENWKKDHPTGNIAFQHLLKGDPEASDNFMYVLARQDADFAMPRHRHNFDQIRLPIKGAMNLGHGFVLEEGQVGYFAEGLAYGPQDDPLGNAKPGERLQLVLQFGGASGYGFMSIEQRRKAWDELSKVGKFVGPHYHRPDGTVQWGLNSVWEHALGAKLKYPRPRYKDPVIVDPRYFNWLHVAGSRGVDHKPMGAFSERGVWVEMVRLGRHAEWSSIDPKSRRLLVILWGGGTADGQNISPLTAIQVDPGETLHMSSATGMEMFLIGLPPIETPALESAEYDYDEFPTDGAA